MMMILLGDSLADYTDTATFPPCPTTPRLYAPVFKACDLVTVHMGCGADWRPPLDGVVHRRHKQPTDRDHLGCYLVWLDSELLVLCHEDEMALRAADTELKRQPPGS